MFFRLRLGDRALLRVELALERPLLRQRLLVLGLGVLRRLLNRRRVLAFDLQNLTVDLRDLGPFGAVFLRELGALPLQLPELGLQRLHQRALHDDAQRLAILADLAHLVPDRFLADARVPRFRDHAVQLIESRDHDVLVVRQRAGILALAVRRRAHARSPAPAPPGARLHPSATRGSCRATRL